MNQNMTVCPPGMGAFSLTDLLKSAVGAIVRGTQVTIPTPTGAQTYDLGNPSHVKALENMVTGTRVTTTTGNKPGVPAIVWIGGGLIALWLLTRKH